MPDGSLAIVASLVVERPHLGQQRATIINEQPMPLRAEGELAEKLIKLDGQVVDVQGELRRRYYSRDGQQRWGQVEVWVQKISVSEDLGE
ncbi:MAG TPA: hypothetical protein EYP39_07050 [Ghiorsea sp.]|nr:hypothetical protein [Ghiorsea sp.]HIP07919.1 hypothetical protein [Mariprofundaceae bacterium]